MDAWVVVTVAVVAWCLLPLPLAIAVGRSLRSVEA